MNTSSLKHPLIALCAAVSLGFAAQAGAMTKGEHDAAKDRIEAAYKASKERCDGLAGNAKDICTSEAKGVESVAKAELDAQYKPTAKSRAKVIEAKADATYDTAKEKCDDLAGNAKDVCVKDAKAAHSAAVEAAKRG